MKYQTYKKYKYIFQKIVDVIRMIVVDFVVLLAISGFLCGIEYLANLL